IFAGFCGTLSTRIHAAGSRIFTSADSSGSAGECLPAKAMDPQFVAGLGSLCRDPAITRAGVRAGPGAVESAGHLSLRRCLRRHGTSPARHDTCLRRSRFIRTLQMAIHFGPVISAGSLHIIPLVGLKGNFADRVLLGRLAWVDADVWLLSHLRRQSGDVRYADPPARFRDVSDLVCDGSGALPVSPERRSRHVLYVWRALHSAADVTPGSASHSLRRDLRVGVIPDA